MTILPAVVTAAALGLQTSVLPVTPTVAPQPAAAPSPAGEPLPPAAEQPLPSVDSVLTRLESADKDITSISGAISLIKRHAAITGGGMEVRYGQLKFASTPQKDGAKPLRRFSIEIDRLIVDGKSHDDPQSYIFDGRDLLEIRPRLKSYVLRHIVGPGTQKDPLRIGEGPFPIPVGQRKDDLLARFAVSVVPSLEAAPESSQLRRILFRCVQLKLIPKEGTDQAKAFSEIRLWYQSPDMMPVFAVTQNTDGTTNEVFLLDVVKNQPIPDSAFNTKPPRKEEGWTGEEQDVRDKATVGPGDPTSRPAAAPASPGPAANPSEPSPAQPK